MQGALLGILLGGLGRDAFKAAAGLALAVAIAIVFALASVLSIVIAVAGVRPLGPSGEAAAAAVVAPPPDAPATGAVAVASRFLGTPYVWGGASPATGFDCSGLTQWSYGRVGVALPRTAQMQFDATARVPRDQLQPGDLVFFANTYPSAEPITHVGIYLGDGQMINAPVEGKPISVMNVFTGFWGAHYAGGGRPGGA